MKKILFLTGTRADFGKLKPLINAVAHHPAFEYEIFATGMHLLARYGNTLGELYKAGFEHVFPCFNQDSTNSADMDMVLANTVRGLGHFVRERRPDLIVVHGDRLEALAGAIVGAFNNILVAHVEGGEVSGTIDELIRHAVSKLSHVHFVANDEARRRLIQLGERPQHVFVIGSPDIDVMLSPELPALETVRQKYAIPFSAYGIFLYHPVTTELNKLEQHIQESVAALKRSGVDFVVIYPNNDIGSATILHELETLAGNPHFRLLPSMRFEYFLTLLKNAQVIVGNSSAGIREAPVYCVPTINLGTRQKNRFSYPTIVNIGEERADIAAALRQLSHHPDPCREFGLGDSARRFLDILCQDSFWNIPQQKQFQDMPAPERPPTA